MLRINQRREVYPLVVSEVELTMEKCTERDAANQAGLRVLEGVLAEASPDVQVAFGDDQHKQFLGNNMPMFCI